MDISERFKIWKACADGNVRPILSAVHIEAAKEQPATGPRLGYAFASDGFEMAVVPVSLSADDVVPCNVHRSAFKAARRLAKANGGKIGLRLGLRAEGIHLADQTILPAASYYVQGEYPDIGKLIGTFVRPDKDTPAVAWGEALPFNIDYARKVGRAIIGNGRQDLIFTQLRRNDAILVEAMGVSYFPKPPFGLVMPMHVDGEGSGAKRRARWTGSKLPVFNPAPEPAPEPVAVAVPVEVEAVTA